MKTVLPIMLIALQAWALAAQAETALSLRLLDSVKVNAAQYRLADIAEIQTDDAALKHELNEMKIGEAPRLGYVERITRESVLALIANRQPALRGHIGATGSEYTDVRSAGTLLVLQPYVDQAGALLLSKLREDRSDIKKFDIQVVSGVHDMTIPLGAVNVTPRINANTKLNKRLCAWLDITVEGKHYQTLPVWFSVKAYKPVLVTKRPAKVHQILRPDDVSIQTQDMAAAPNALTDFTALPTAQWLKRPLAQGAVLAADDLEEMPLVQGGQNVRVTLAMGPVYIETEGVAQIYGHMGDIVRVQNTQTKGIYAARVTGVGAVTVNTRE